MASAGSVCVNDRLAGIPKELRRPAAGVDRAVREALSLALGGAADRTVAELIHRHDSFRRPGGPAAWIRRLRQLRQEMPDRVDDLEALAVHAMSCPLGRSDSDR
ncbi:hypothetical protein [Catenuloplanes indicus]|uniref:Nucleic acid-binding Zn ribbon protein n=1 Tax=Catenuloplanes indicus TaxID=137267 RepID=A0AAE4B1V6_9ACTN|nr:hypothetical protein [Catenuloplanes indicus]MDQ0370006.1 putative nucleic acid-binding Zn ribbon protein [Catenuloplanes indicus]